MNELGKILAGLLVFILIIWFLFYFTIFILFLIVIFVWIFYAKKIFYTIKEKFFWWEKKTFYEENFCKNEKIKKKFFLDDKIDEKIIDAEIEK